MRTFEQVKAWAIANVPALAGFKHYPGPYIPDDPGKFVLWTRYGGPGEELEGVMDAISWQARVVGGQNDYNSAENGADGLDVAILSIGNRTIGGTRVSGVRRVGGAPNSLMVDDADRTHMVCSYIVSTELALTN